MDSVRMRGSARVEDKGDLSAGEEFDFTLRSADWNKLTINVTQSATWTSIKPGGIHGLYWVALMPEKPVDFKIAAHSFTLRGPLVARLRSGSTIISVKNADAYATSNMLHVWIGGHHQALTT